MPVRSDTTPERPATSVAGSLTVTVVIAATVLFFSLRPLSLGIPGWGLDASWETVLGEKAQTGAAWGIDLAFTYGPAAALVTRYLTASYLGSVVPVVLAVALVVGLCVERTLAAAGARGGRRFAFAAMAAVGLAEIHLDQDPLYFALALLIALLDLERPGRDRAALLAVGCGAFLMGVAGLAKSSFGIVALPLFLLSDLRSTVLRRPPVLVLCFLIGAGATFLWHGQHAADIPTYLRMQWAVVAGYGEAMYLVGDRRELVAYLVSAGALLLVTAVLSGVAGRVERLHAVAIVAFVLLIGLKAGFVRQDSHTQIAWQTLGLAGLLTAIAVVLPRSAALAAVVGTASLAVLWIAAPLLLLKVSDGPVGLDGLAQQYRETAQDALGEVEEWKRWFDGPGAFAAAKLADKDDVWRQIAAAHPLPRLSGSVDMLPSEQGTLLANGLDYRPRPSFQEYETYSDALIAANAAFYAKPSPPDWVIFGIGGLDERYPNTTEGALWPDLLRRYEPVRTIDDNVLLHRRDVPLPVTLGAVQHRDVRLNEPVAIPRGGPLLARIDVRKTLLGRLAAMLFRPPAVAMQVKFVDGREQTFRFIPAIAAAGFILSPMIEDGRQYASLGFGWGLPANAVAEVTIGAGHAGRFFYADNMSIDIQTLQVGSAPPSPEARSLYDSLGAQQDWETFVNGLGVGKPFENGHLSAQPPSTITVPVAGAGRIHLGFGIEDGAWTTGRTQGVCFDLKGNGSEVLWHRCLDPMATPADRDEQSADITLPPGTTSVLAETSCPRSCDWGWSYWSDMRPAL